MPQSVRQLISYKSPASLTPPNGDFKQGKPGGYDQQQEYVNVHVQQQQQQASGKEPSSGPTDVPAASPRTVTNNVN